MADRNDPGRLYAIVAEFDRPDALVEAARRAREAGFTRIEAFSPFPVEGLAEVLGFKERRIGPITLIGAVAGAVSGFAVQVGPTLDFPLDVGGRPILAWPAFALIGFELTVLGAVLAAILGMLILDRLPRLHHPLFEVESFHLATSDKFFLAVLAEDPAFDPAKVRRRLAALHPVRIADAPYAEAVS